MPKPQHSRIDRTITKARAEILQPKDRLVQRKPVRGGKENTVAPAMERLKPTCASAVSVRRILLRRHRLGRLGNTEDVDAYGRGLIGGSGRFRHENEDATDNECRDGQQ